MPSINEQEAFFVDVAQRLKETHPGIEAKEVKHAIQEAIKAFGELTYEHGMESGAGVFPRTSDYNDRPPDGHHVMRMMYALTLYCAGTPWRGPDDPPNPFI